MRLLLFGASGSAGGAVLRVCLASADVEEVQAVARRPLSQYHSKLIEVLHDNYLDFTPIASVFAGIDACLYCLGKSVRQVADEQEYRRITHAYAIAAARTLREQSPDATFHFISGAGSDLNSRFMWARVKAETERDLMEQFDAVCYRPAAIDGLPSGSEPLAYKLLRPVSRLLFKPFRSLYVSGDDLGRAMLVATARGIRRQIIENAQIRQMASSRT